MILAAEANRQQHVDSTCAESPGSFGSPATWMRDKGTGAPATGSGDDSLRRSLRLQASSPDAGAAEKAVSRKRSLATQPKCSTCEVEPSSAAASKRPRTRQQTRRAAKGKPANEPRQAEDDESGADGKQETTAAERSRGDVQDECSESESSSGACGEDSDETWDEDDKRESQRCRALAMSRAAAASAKAVLRALAGPLCPADCSETLPQREANIRQSMSCGCTNLQKDYWGPGDNLQGASGAFSSLREHQRVAVRWLMAMHSCSQGMVIADEMGLGKTLEALCFLEALSSRKPSLVIAPASLLDNWEAEVARWTPRLRTLKYHTRDGSSRQDLRERFFRDPEQYQLVLATPHALLHREDRALFFRRIEFEYLVCDEAHSLKSQNTGVFRNLHRTIRSQRRLLLTGTPVQNSLEELANLLGFALSSQDDVDILRHLQEMSKQPTGRAMRRLQTLVAPFILRRLKEDVLPDLPPKRGVVVYCDMNERQRAHYDDVLDASRRKHQGEQVDSRTVIEAYRRLLRVCLHPVLGQAKWSSGQRAELCRLLSQPGCKQEFEGVAPAIAQGEVDKWSDYDCHTAAQENSLPAEYHLTPSEFLCSTKTMELLRIIRQQMSTGQKTLVFSQFVMVLDVLEAALTVEGINYYRLDGTTDIAERHELVSTFQAEGGPLVFLMTTKSGGVGLNLTAANVVVMLDLDFNPHNMRQAEDRAHRIGQGRDVTVYYLVCRGTVEEMVLKRILKKMHLDVHFGGRSASFEAAAAGGLAADEEAKKTQQAVVADLRALLAQAPKRPPPTARLPSTASWLQSFEEFDEDTPLSVMADNMSLLPEDAPQGHVAYQKLKFDDKPNRMLVFFHYADRREGTKTHFQVTINQAGSLQAAQRIARVCYLKFEEGWSKEEVVAYKRSIFEKLSSGRPAIPAAPGQADTAASTAWMQSAPITCTADAIKQQSSMHASGLPQPAVGSIPTPLRCHGSWATAQMLPSQSQAFFAPPPLAWPSSGMQVVEDMMPNEYVQHWGLAEQARLYGNMVGQRHLSATWSNPQMPDVISGPIDCDAAQMHGQIVHDLTGSVDRCDAARGLQYTWSVA
eukprot:TRINITY_DN10377_c0_g1_i1.p1 TRINITY_DN10377_c0_g1~~TRINITY_DN10377_c0_g1_i1.p1  ORF type:complete len:1081 (-),score=215.82 TRINITY_DN10377_c0_g1_i1:53-3295(-)